MLTPLRPSGTKPAVWEGVKVRSSVKFTYDECSAARRKGKTCIFSGAVSRLHSYNYGVAEGSSLEYTRFPASSDSVRTRRGLGRWLSAFVMIPRHFLVAILSFDDAGQVPVTVAEMGLPHC